MDIKRKFLVEQCQSSYYCQIPTTHVWVPMCMSKSKWLHSSFWKISHNKSSIGVSFCCSSEAAAIIWLWQLPWTRWPQLQSLNEGLLKLPSHNESLLVEQENVQQLPSLGDCLFSAKDQLFDSTPTNIMRKENLYHFCTENPHLFTLKQNLVYLNYPNKACVMFVTSLHQPLSTEKTEIKSSSFSRNYTLYGS